MYVQYIVYLYVYVYIPCILLTFMAFVYLLDPKIFEVATGRGLPTERRPFLGVIGEQGQAPRGTPGRPVYAGFTIENGGFTIENGDFIMENG